MVADLLVYKGIEIAISAAVAFIGLAAFALYVWWDICREKKD